MRDSFATEDHFRKLIVDFTNVREKGLRDLADGTKKERRPGSAQRRYWKYGLDVLEAKYSVGTAIDELRPEFASLVAELPRVSMFDASSATDHDWMVTVSAWSVLLDDATSAEILAQVAERGSRFAGRLLSLLGHFELHPARPTSEAPLVDGYEIYAARDAQVAGDAQLASELLFRFVNERWFQHVYNSGFRPITHSGKMNGHVGYWCYEAAAFAKAYGIDDARLEGHKYYPWDLRRSHLG